MRLLRNLRIGDIVAIVLLAGVSVYCLTRNQR